MPCPASIQDEMIIKGNKGLPETMTSAQVPLSSTLPSGQVHLAPVGLSRHMKSQDILRHGFDAAERENKNTLILLFGLCLIVFLFRLCMFPHLCLILRLQSISFLGGDRILMSDLNVA